MAKKKTPINYTNRDFSTIKEDLVNYAKRNYPDIYKDFNEASFGSLMLDTVAYVGDIASFYLDYQVNESFLDTAVEYRNVERLSRQQGYKFTGSPTSTGIVSFYIVVPANSTGTGPDLRYAPILRRDSQFSSAGGVPYILIDSVNFANPNNEVAVARVNDSTGVPITYAIKANGRVISGRLVQETFQVGEYQRFRRLFNRASTNDTVPAILRPFSVPRRFTVEKDGNLSYLQFGYGSADNLSSQASVAEPSNVVLEMNGKNYISDLDFDPSRLLETDKFGVVPVNTTLTVKYRVNTADNVNSPVGALNVVENPIFSYNNIRQLTRNLVNQVNRSLEVYNQDPIIGDVSDPTSEELRIRTKDFFATQNRAVTGTDYEAMVYAMPSKFGSVKRCRILRDPEKLESICSIRRYKW
jgi:hypothetical protein